MTETDNNTSKLKDYARVCFKIGVVMSIFFVSSMVCSVSVREVTRVIKIESATLEYFLMLLANTVFLYIIPIVSALAILKGEGENRLSPKTLYKKPARFTKALGNFPAVYGLGQMTNLLCLAVVWIAEKISQNMSAAEQSETVQRSFGTMNSLVPPNAICGALLFIHMVFAAAFFEELICRGILLNALKPYGNGFAIIVTGFIFGMMHGNFQQFFYAFVLGIVFAYITIQTGSILTSTVLHAMFNSMAAVVMLFISTAAVRSRFLGQAPSPDEGESGKLIVAVFAIYLALFFILLITGIAMAVKKLTRLKAYKAENPFTEITAKKKTVMFFTSASVILMLALAADRFAGGFIVKLILKENF